MKEYIKVEAPHDMEGAAITLVDNYLFNVNEEATKLP